MRGSILFCVSVPSLLSYAKPVLSSLPSPCVEGTAGMGHRSHGGRGGSSLVSLSPRGGSIKATSESESSGLKLMDAPQTNSVDYRFRLRFMVFTHEIFRLLFSAPQLITEKFFQRSAGTSIGSQIIVMPDE
jgi:hypothetical protein